MLARSLGLAFAGALGVTWAAAAPASPLQEQACIASVADLRNIERNDVSIESDSGGDGGPTEIFFRALTVRGSCLFDSRDRLIDVRIAGGTLPWNGKGGGDVSAQEQACVGEMARRFNVPMARVGISDTRPARRGGRQMVVALTGARVRCVTTQFNAITEFVLLPN